MQPRFTAFKFKFRTCLQALQPSTLCGVPSPERLDTNHCSSYLYRFLSSLKEVDAFTLRLRKINFAIGSCRASRQLPLAQCCSISCQAQTRSRSMPAPGQACCAHDHDCEEADCGTAYSLHRHIDLSNVWALNEGSPGQAKQVFRAWEDRLNFDAPALLSNDEDPELLIHVPFTGSVKLRAICIIGGEDGTAPSEMKAYINRDDLDFSTVADLPPLQKWDLQENIRGDIEYPTHVTKFNGVHSIDLHIPMSFCGNQTKIHYIGFKGDFKEAKREAVAAVYESKPLISDHEVRNETTLSRQIS